MKNFIDHFPKGRYLNPKREEILSLRNGQVTNNFKSEICVSLLRNPRAIDSDQSDLPSNRESIKPRDDLNSDNVLYNASSPAKILYLIKVRCSSFTRGG